MAAKFPENIEQMTVAHVKAKPPSGFPITRILTTGYVREVSGLKKEDIAAKCSFCFFPTQFLIAFAFHSM